MHAWEAILATAAIVLWHVYHVVWKPDVLPRGNRAWLDGKLTFHQYVQEHPSEYAEAMGWLPAPGEDPRARPETTPTHSEGEGISP